MLLFDDDSHGVGQHMGQKMDPLDVTMPFFWLLYLVTVSFFTASLNLLIESAERCPLVPKIRIQKFWIKWLGARSSIIETNGERFQVVAELLHCML
jgi:hypothetical protein